jgi:hypothetical protein
VGDNTAGEVSKLQWTIGARVKGTPDQHHTVLYDNDWAVAETWEFTDGFKAYIRTPGAEWPKYPEDAVFPTQIEAQRYAEITYRFIYQQKE